MLLLAFKYHDWNFKKNLFIVNLISYTFGCRVVKILTNV